MSSDNKPSATYIAASCFYVTWQIVVMFPLWVALVYAVLSASDAPPWAWLVFYCYVPAVLVGCLFRVLATLSEKT